jgi:hypothetical protein
MVSIKGIYDGNTITPLEAAPRNKSFKVIITFTEEIETPGMVSEPDFREIGSIADGFSFWENEEEDIYQDYLENKPQIPNRFGIVLKDGQSALPV